MSNEVRVYTIKLRCNEAFYRSLVLLLRYAGKLGLWGSSRNVGIYFDGDGSDRVEIMELLEPVAESKKGILPDGSFHIDTDAVFSSVDE